MFVLLRTKTSQNYDRQSTVPTLVLPQRVLILLPVSAAPSLLCFLLPIFDLLRCLLSTCFRSALLSTSFLLGSRCLRSALRLSSISFMLGSQRTFEVYSTCFASVSLFFSCFRIPIVFRIIPTKQSKHI
ncbi:uncharacterized protein HD556DRAFT_1358799 [Suillus plorans]|uniref:Transmembrane protein n=1 Tax=Suillus plorans TaxID=116603 RepID=A0A9P7AYK3_9AGAM|nr:uncharacterized protein HD556DRAFT_1365584 [Suillus plorans]XP_041161974.1 uncharacterized protein HD556DRAFT_1358799 [Suillus plorans]KAG1795033.1 hypothetical protein HD556DRAFT_1365584 [Suillus plorans]KAG1796617.1 hypothetical protein HD556DRAFT_1358799 [Suillus plorans]